MRNLTDQTILQPEELLQFLEQETSSLHIGIVGNDPESSETRMLLTPEGCGLLTSTGISVSIEAGAGTDISFLDEQYADYGVNIVSREEALQAPIVLSYACLSPKDLMKMRPGSAFLCMMTEAIINQASIKVMLERNIACGCLDNMLSHNDEPVFANIVDEIDGKAAIMFAQDALSFSGGGKGVLLGGIAGINPCEVLLIGMGNDMIHAAKAAAAIGARVTLMDNDISALQIARDSVGPMVDNIAIHPKVLYNKIKTADVLILGSTTHEFHLPANLNGVMKDNIYILDMKETSPSETVPRTVAMGISNALVNFFNEMILKDGFMGMLSTTPGMQYGMVTYNGRLVDQLLASYLGLPSVDISVMLSPFN